MSRQHLKVEFLSFSVCSNSFVSPTDFFFPFPPFYTLIYFSIVHLPAILTPSFESTVFPMCLVDKLREHDSVVETTAHLLSFLLRSPAHLPLSLLLFHCCADRSPFQMECPFASCTFLISQNEFFSPTLQGPLTLRFIVSVEAEVDCLLPVMYFH